MDTKGGRILREAVGNYKWKKGMKMTMKRNHKSVISVLLVLAIALMLFGCASNPAVSSGGASGTESKTGASSEAGGSETVYPMQTDVTLKIWMTVNADVASVTTGEGGYASIPFGKALSEQTGVKIEWQHPLEGAENPLGMLVSSNDLPDIIIAGWDISGGPEKACQDNVIVKLNDLVDRYCPNLKAYMEKNPTAATCAKTDDGTLYGFPMFQEDPVLTNVFGLMCREDALKSAGLDTPKTIDDWTEALRAFKKAGADKPISFSDWYLDMFYGAYGGFRGFNVIDGKVQCGYTADGMKDALATLASWYKEGLLDENFINADVKSQIVAGNTMATIGYAGSALGTYNTAFKENGNTGWSVAPMPAPVAETGGNNLYGATSNYLYLAANNGYITAQCENQEIAAKFMDYAYSDAGYLLFNFGIEGESFEMKSGVPTYTDAIMSNPDGLNFTQALCRYALSAHSGPFVQSKNYITQYYSTPQQNSALTIWENTYAADHAMPPVSMTAEESEKYTSIMTNVSTAFNEYALKVIMGTESVDRWDDIVGQINGFGIDDAQKIAQAAYDRFVAR